MDDFIRPNKPLRPSEPDNTSDTGIDTGIEAGQGPIERPTLFNRDAQDVQSKPMVSAEAIAEEEAAAASASAATGVEPVKKRRFARKHLIALISIAVAMVLAGGAFFFMNRSDTPTDTNADQQAAKKMTAAASAVEGTVEFKRGEADWQELFEDTELQNDDQIRTKDDSRAAITFGEDSVIRLSGSTRVTITSLANERITIANNAGIIYARVAQSKETKDRTFAIEIDDESITAKGTAFKTFNTGDTTGVEVYHNEVDVQDNEVKQGEAYFIDSPDAAKKGKVTPIDIEQLKNDAFIAWCIGQDKDNDLFKDDLGFLGDFDGPELSIDSPKDGDVIKVTEGATIGASIITGKTEKGAKVSVVTKSANGDSNAIEATVDAVGGYGTGLISGPVGKVTYEVTARDANGNKTVKTITVEYKVEAAATPTPTPSGTPVTILSTSFLDGGIKVNWQVGEGQDISSGFRVVWSKESKPTYPEDSSAAAGYDGRIHVIPADDVEDGETYYIRVCIVSDGACAVNSYSNEITAVAPNQ